MKRFLPAFILALIVHLAVLKFDRVGIFRQNRVPPQTRVTTMQLVQRAPVVQPAIRPLSPPSSLLPEPTSVPQKPVKRKVTTKPKAVQKKLTTNQPGPQPIRKPPPPPSPQDSSPPESPPPAESKPVQQMPVPPTPYQPAEFKQNDRALDPAVPAPVEASPETPVTSDAVSAVVLATPRYHENPPPSYPSIARKRKYQGTVTLEVFVKEDGRVGDLRVAESSNYALLDRAAMKTVNKWKFTPGREADRAVAMWVKVPIRFRLE